MSEVGSHYHCHCSNLDSGMSDDFTTIAEDRRAATIAEDRRAATILKNMFEMFLLICLPWNLTIWQLCTIHFNMLAI